MAEKFSLNGTRTAPLAPSKMLPAGNTVNKDTTRSGVAKTPGTLGPRTA